MAASLKVQRLERVNRRHRDHIMRFGMSQCLGARPRFDPQGKSIFIPIKKSRTELNIPVTGFLTRLLGLSRLPWWRR